MRRRTAIVGTGGWAVLAAAGAQTLQGGKSPPLIGWLGITPRDGGGRLIEAFTARLKGLGYVVGRDVAMEVRLSNRDAAKLPALARELVALEPAVIVAIGGFSATAAAQVTRTIPIVASGIISPVATGLVASLARPGGNVTGTTSNQPEIAGKLVEVLKIAAPRVTRVAVIRNPDFPGMRLYSPYSVGTALELGMTLHYLEVRHPSDFSTEKLERLQPHAVYVAYDSVVGAIMDQVIRYANDHRLPSIGVSRLFIESGGLLAMGPDQEELDAVIADYVVRILKGASAAELPIQQPSRFQLIVNRKTADAIGLVISQELLLRASEVVQ